MSFNFTTVVGIDAKHFEQLCMVWLTWKLHKPSLLHHPMIVFVDRENPVDPGQIWKNIDHPNLTIHEWPPEGVTYPYSKIDSKDKFGKPQRYKMMAGFVHIPAQFVQTPYWLKLDADAIALGQDDWINPSWFDENPRIVAHRWGFTKPAGLIKQLDDWSMKGLEHSREFETQASLHRPLGLPIDNPESERISHPRICSWCGFFNTEFTKYASAIANETCGRGLLPVPSQDTYLWYLATQLNPSSVVRVNMKQHGWTYRSSFNSVRDQVVEALKGVLHGI